MERDYHGGGRESGRGGSQGSGGSGRGGYYGGEGNSGGSGRRVSHGSGGSGRGGSQGSGGSGRGGYYGGEGNSGGSDRRVSQGSGGSGRGGYHGGGGSGLGGYQGGGGGGRGGSQSSGGSGRGGYHGGGGSGRRSFDCQSRSASEYGSPWTQQQIDVQSCKYSEPENSRGSNLYGRNGTKITMIVNYYQMKFPDRMIFNYRVDFFVKSKEGKEVEIKKKSVKKEVFWRIASENREIFPNAHTIVYDGGHRVITAEKLPLSSKESVITLSFNMSDCRNIDAIVKVKEEKELCTRLDVSAISLMLTQSARNPTTELARHTFCDTNDRIFLSDSTTFKALDLKSIFNMFKGLRSAVKQGVANHFFINLDICHSAFYKVEMEILSLYSFCTIGYIMGEKDLQKVRIFGLNEGQKRRLKKILHGLMLKTRVGMPGHHRFKTLSNYNANELKVPFVQVDAHGKQIGSEVMVTVREYYKKKYDYTLKYPFMPLIECGNQKTLSFPIEVLITSDKLQRFRQKLPDALIKDSNKYTTTRPAYRFTDINMIAKELGIQKDPVLKKFGVDFGDFKMLEIEGRVLNTPRMEDGDSLTAVLSYIFINVSASASGYASYSVLIEGCRRQGISVLQDRGRPVITSVELKESEGQRNAYNIFVNVLKEHVRKVRNVMNADHRSVVIVIINERSEFLYHIIKSACEIECNVMSQVLLETKFKGLTQSYSLCRNIVLKLKAKLGGITKQISTSDVGQSATIWRKFTNHKEPTLFIGIDVTHPPVDDNSFPSLAALVSNVDIKATKYGSSVRSQMSRQENIQDMKAMCGERIAEFRRWNNQNPAHIVILRDGVSEGQFGTVMRNEIIQLEEACKEQYGNGRKPTITVLIVQKRHSTRFYIKDQDQRACDSKKEDQNAPPGTVIDRHITGNQLMEYYLCSHKGILGTSRPTHYFVLRDTWKLSADEIQCCTYNLCQLFARSDKSVSYPAPTYYAHLACYRARAHLQTLREVRPHTREEEIKESTDLSKYDKFITVGESLRNTMYFC